MPTINETNCEEKKVKAEQTENIFENLLPNMPRNLPTEDINFNPTPPKKVYSSTILSTQHLTKRIYLEMLRAITSYAELEDIAPESDRQTITNLKNQMEILSLAILNIYGKMSRRAKVPYFSNGRTPLSRNYQTALQQMYDRVYHIHSLVFKLIARSGDEFRSTLIIVLTNLKSQLKTLEGLKR